MLLGQHDEALTGSWPAQVCVRSGVYAGWLSSRGWACGAGCRMMRLSLDPASSALAGCWWLVAGVCWLKPGLVLLCKHRKALTGLCNKCSSRLVMADAAALCGP